MGGASLSRRAVFIIFLAWTTGPLSAFSIGIIGDMTFQIASAEGYGPKEQGGGGAELYTFFPFADWIGMGLFFGLSETLPSDTTGGFAYRGYGTGAIGLFAEVHFRLSSVGTLGTLFGGGRAGLSADWGSYQYTSLYFFYPEEVTEGFLFLRLASLPSLQVRLSLPVRLQFRRDMTYSYSAALGLGAIYTFGGTR